MDLVERCAECGFDGSDWTDQAAIEEIGSLGDQWSAAVVGLSNLDAAERPVEGMWSIGEYVDHVREVLFGMRFVLGVAVEQPGTDLGPAPANAFDPEAKLVDLTSALDSLRSEADQLVAALNELAHDSWSAIVRFDGESHDVHWICRHAVHDATHHLGDVEMLREATISDGAE